VKNIGDKVAELALEMLEENKVGIKKEMCENYIKIINKAPDMIENLVDALAESIASEGTKEGGDG